MKMIVWMGLCSMGCAAFAQEARINMEVNMRDAHRAFVVTQSSGFAEPGTVLHPAPARPNAMYCGDFTNGALHLRFGTPSQGVATSVFALGTAVVTNIEAITVRDFSLRDRRSGKVFDRDFTNGAYVCGNEFAVLTMTNLLVRRPRARNLVGGKQLNLPSGFARCLNLTNSLTLAEAQARGIDIKLREVLTLEIEADPQWGPTPVIRRRWVLSSEPFGEKIPGPATTW